MAITKIILKAVDIISKISVGIVMIVFWLLALYVSNDELFAALQWAKNSLLIGVTLFLLYLIGCGIKSLTHKDEGDDQ